VWKCRPPEPKFGPWPTPAWTSRSQIIKFGLPLLEAPCALALTARGIPSRTWRRPCWRASCSSSGSTRASTWPASTGSACAASRCDQAPSPARGGVSRFRVAALPNRHCDPEAAPETPLPFGGRSRISAASSRQRVFATSLSLCGAGASRRNRGRHRKPWPQGRRKEPPPAAPRRAEGTCPPHASAHGGGPTTQALPHTRANGRARSYSRVGPVRSGPG
jgi:hypothetical protein